MRKNDFETVSEIISYTFLFFALFIMSTFLRTLTHSFKKTDTANYL